MPKSRDTSPSSHESSARSVRTEEETTAPSFLQVPEEATQITTVVRPPTPAASSLALPTEETTQPTRTRSPARLTSELQVRARIQEERLDTIISIVEDLEATASKEPLQLIATELKIIRDTLLELHLTFQQEHKALSCLWPVSQLEHGYFKMKVASSEEKAVLSARKLVAQLEHRLTPAAPPPQTTQPTQTTQPEPRRSRLPEVPLPKFEGDYSRWPEFKSVFTSVILERPELTETDRLHYLKGAVSGSAAQLICHLPPTREAFAQAWALLDARFENKRLNVQTHMDRIYELKAMRVRKAASLVKMTNIIGETMEAMKTFGLADPHNCYLLSVLVRLLDADTREHWEHSLASQKEYPTMEQLTNFLLERAGTLEQLERLAERRSAKTSSTPSPRTSQTTPHRPSAPKATEHTAAGTQPTSAPASGRSEPSRPRTSAHYPCAFCTHDHFLAVCPAFRQLTPNDRADVTRDKQLGVNCLGHHNLRSCRTAQRCKLCNEHHHTVLHGSDLSRVLVPGLRTAQPTTSTPLPRNTPAPSTSESLVNQLRLRRQRSSLDVHGVGGARTSQTNGVVNITLHSNYRPLSVTVHAYVLPKVTTCLPSDPPAHPTLPSHLEKLNLADPQFLTSRPVDIILGADAYGQEEPPQDTAPLLTPEEQECDHFKTTHSRDSSGRYIVRLPLKLHPRALGNSYQTAHNCLQRTLRRLSKDAQYNQLYTKFMLEYEQLGHMLGSTTTTLRVVFNGSSPTSSGFSLNDLLHTGPNLMLNIADLLIWIRRYKHLFATDVTKMYRQIKKETQYQLTMVTYGTKAAAYLTVRTLLQLADDEGSKYPLAVEPIKDGRYVDDIFGGADTAEHLQDVANQLTQLCQAGGFPLAKWHSTSKSLLEDLAPDQNNAAISFDDCATKILGIKWISHQDTLNFSTISATQRTQFTKRLVLSEVAQLFDPLGFVAPVIIRAKILIQELWLQELGWDDILPCHITQQWLRIREDLTSLARLSIPRWFNTATTSTVELHGFSDASVLAMAAVVYLVVHAPSTDYS
ncbi:uncharacterized protein LOC123988736 [Osmia bicornis bicornis]|uniref:uncharacterized protein LOC123988736 n=1 Tax=Osmia bicornis bicornis TaxID=1437191 RepID=UPI001EAF6B43|nr:uncharacterized protein LOC123988736 [Osmia bicornis bicornis]